MIIDDTEHFVAQASGEIQRESVHDLYHHAIRTLAEMQDLDVVVAMHPRYQAVDVVGEVAARFGFREVQVAALPAARDESALAAILQKRLDANEIASALEDVIDRSALAQLEGVYFLNGHDLREVLDLAHEAAEAAHQDGADRIAPRHVQPLLDRRGSPQL